MRIGLLGSGEMGKRHMAAADGLPTLEIVTRSTPPYDSFASCERTALLSAMLADSSIDAIDICLPTPLHASTACAALIAGKHVLCEKPLALSTADCAKVLSVAHDTGCTFMVAHVLRFFPAYRYLLRLVRNGTYGSVQHASFTRASGVPDWAGWLSDASSSGGAILDLLVHDFDQVICLFGLPSHIRATCIESPDTVRAVLSCGNVSVLVEGGWFSDNRAFAMGFDVEFTRAHLVYRDERLTLYRGHAQDETISLEDVNPYREQLRYFIQCCNTHSAPVECPPEASSAAVALALAVREQAAKTPIS